MSATVRDNGVPIVHGSNSTVYSYDPALLSWVKLAEHWWSEGSDFWQGRQRGNSTTANRGIMSAIEGSIAGIPDESAAEIPRPNWWSAALTLGHLETRMLSTKLLESPQEYRQALLMYAKKIADEGFRGKAEELVRELFGPVYWSVFPPILRLVQLLIGIPLVGDLGGKIVGNRRLSGFRSGIC
jgi:protein HIRA/HIR1